MSFPWKKIRSAVLAWIDRREVSDSAVTFATAILVGVGPLKGPMMAKYMRDFVPGITMPDHVIERIEAAGAHIPPEEKPERQKAWRAEGLKMCIELIQELSEIEGVSGAHVMAIEWEEAVHGIVDGAGLLPRPVV